MTRVLAVDDDPVILKLLEVNFELEGFEVVTAGDGDQAIEVARSARPDIILLDVMMPRKDGWQVAQVLLADPDVQHIPIVFLSARAQDADIERGLALGVADYITKPFDPIDLVDRVRELTAPAEASG